MGRLVRGNAAVGAQTRGGSYVGIRPKVRRRRAARGWECGRRYADGAKPGLGVGHESAQAWGGWEVGIRA